MKLLHLQTGLSLWLSSLILESDSGGSDSDSGSSDSSDSGSESSESSGDSTSSADSSEPSRRNSAQSSAQSSDSSAFSDDASVVVASSWVAQSISPEFEERRQERLGNRVGSVADFSKIPFQQRER